MLNQSEQNQLCQKLRDLHSNDQKQLEVIFSESKRLIVEAPAGYGKTKTMISKVAYLLATGKISRPKKILALTFSVNAAYKIKKELAEHLPTLVQSDNSNQLRINDKLFVSNYHGFCRHILKIYGYLLHPNLSNPDLLKSVDDAKIKEITEILNISYEKASAFTEYSDAVKTVNRQYLSSHFNQYTNGIIETFLDKKYISFNGILALTLRLFTEYSEILQFYQGYFPVIIVDEFQDTNALSWALLNKLVNEKSQLFFMGDSLQRIYGFIGAIPNLIVEAENLFSMDRIALEKNYRFMSNPQMLQLDKNIRLNAEKPDSPAIQANAEVSLISVNTQLEEAQEIVQKIRYLFSSEEDKSCKAAILVKQRGANINKIIEILENNEISYFYALFGDDDSDYLSFHRECSSQFTDQLRKDTRILKGILNKFYLQVEEVFKNSKSPIIKSLLNLLKVFLSRILIDYSFLSIEDKLFLIRDTFENRTLKQNMEYINENVIISTIHGAKGLEWDYVLMPDMEQYSMPNWYGLCGNCNHKSNCNLTVNSSNENKFLEELSVFYVGVTRARKQIFFSASKNRLKADGTTQKANLSCMLKLPGIVLPEI
ncbi:MAG: ATP-dependent helicase [Planktothrix rubescens PR222]